MPDNAKPIWSELMKNVAQYFLLSFCCCCLIAGCNAETAKTVNNADTTPVSTTLENDLCASCGCCAKCDSCCKGEKCGDCKMQKGSELCCKGVSPEEGVYCKACGFKKDSDSCCAESNTKCDCGLAKGSPLCCKLNKDDASKEEAEVTEAAKEEDAG